MANEFNKQAFETAFAAALIAIAAAEKVTKEELRILSRTVLEAWHATGNVDYANNLLNVLTPVNRKVAVLYFTHFSGFSYDEKQAKFTGKSKKRYDDALAECVKFLEDPLNNIWVWAGRNIEIEQKDFDLKAVTKYVEGALKKADKAKLRQADVLKAIFAAGITPASLLIAFNEMEFKDGEKNTLEIPLEVLGGEQVDAAKQ